MKGKKIYILSAILGMCVLIACFIIGGYKQLDWLILLGFGICGVDFITVGITYFVNFIRRLNKELEEEAKQERTSERDTELLNEINSAVDAEQSKIAQAKYYGNGAKNVGELTASAFGITKENVNAFKEASFREKLKPIIFFALLALTMLAFYVGIMLSSLRVQPVGFILMGVGGGSFFLSIIGLLIASVTDRLTYGISKDLDKPSKAPHMHGVVKRCEIHSQHKTGNNKAKISGTLYQIWVWTSDKKPIVRLVCSRRYNKYDKVTFIEKRGLFRTIRKIIED